MVLVENEGSGYCISVHICSFNISSFVISLITYPYLTHSLSLYLSHAISLTLSHSISFTLSHSLSLYLSHSLSPTLFIYLCHSLTISHSLSHSIHNSLTLYSRAKLSCCRRLSTIFFCQLLKALECSPSPPPPLTPPPGMLGPRPPSPLATPPANGVELCNRWPGTWVA